MLTKLADLATRAPKRVLAAALFAFGVAGALGGSVAQRLDPYGAEDPATQSVQARQQVERVTGMQADAGLVALVETPGGVGGAQPRSRVHRVAREIQRDPAVGSVASYFQTGQREMLAADGRATYVVASFRALPDREVAKASDRLHKRLEEIPGVTVGGAGVASAQVNEVVASDLQRAELLAFPILFALSLLFFRSLVAALLPLVVGLLTIVLTFLGLRIASELGSISVFALNLVTGLGLGLAIDYSLFIVSRYREEIARSGPGREALRRTMATAGRTVLFSSLTVSAALASLLAFPQRFLYSMGLGGMLVALVACAVALVVLPAVLALLGERVNALAPRRLRRAAERDARPASSGAWYRLSRFVMRRPGRVALAAAATLIALGAPFASIKFTSVDASVLPASSSARQVHEALQHRFPSDREAPIVVVADARAGGPGASSRLAAELRRLPGVAAVTAPREVGGGTAVVDVVSGSGVFSAASQDLVRRIRAASTDVKVGGQTAAFVDTKASLAAHLPLAFAIIALTTLVVLFLMTGSVVLPLKALVMNVLTLSAAFGMLVLIFQDGRLEGLLGYTSQGALEASQPVVLFALAFGLSTDYGVFLLARIKESRDAGASDREAVAVGLERTGRIVTAAALLFCIAIGAFATSRIIFIKEVGMGTALAVLIDATLVRALLVPSLMELLGRRNWWAPAGLRRLHARVGLGEGEPRAQGAGA
jgi:RND superfamily putative drug exporter